MVATNPQTKSIIRSIVWEIPSATRRGVTHTVSEDVETGARRCTCEASDHAKTCGKCWHLRAVASGLAGKPTVRISQRPTVTAEQLPGESLWQASVRVQGEVRRRREWTEATQAATYATTPAALKRVRAVAV